MANKKIEDLTALGTTFATADIFEISRWTGSAFVSRKITGSEMSSSITASNIGNSDLQVNSSLVIRQLQLGGSTTSDGFAVRNFADTKNFLTVLGDGQVYSSGSGGTVSNQIMGYLSGGGAATQNAIYGYQAGKTLGGAANNNVAMGYNALSTGSGAYQTVAVGASAAVPNSSFNGTYVGYQSGTAATGDSNTLIGSRSGVSVAAGYDNTMIGQQSGGGVTTGYRNTIVNHGAPTNTGLTTGWNNTIIGNHSGMGAGNWSHAVLADGAGGTAIHKDNNQNVYFSDNTALATTATNGFVYVRGGAGVPTGTPATAVTGHVPMYADTTNNKLYIYSGGAWVALN